MSFELFATNPLFVDFKFCIPREEAGFFTSHYCQTLQLNVSSGAQITERDEAPLKYLVDIISDKDLGDSEQKGFRLHFHFLPNPYFENT